MTSKTTKKELTEEELARDLLLLAMLEESDRRMKRIEAKYDPVTGDGLQWMENPITHESLYNRERIEIPDHIIPVQWMPEEMRRNELVKAVLEYGSIKDYISNEIGVTPRTIS